MGLMFTLHTLVSDPTVFAIWAGTGETGKPARKFAGLCRSGSLEAQAAVTN